MQWSVTDLLFGDGLAHDIFWRIRLPRVLLGFTAGAALGGAGVVFQALFRNPLASPYTFGITSGASFGAALAIILGFTTSFYGVYGITLGGMLGGLFVTMLIYFVAAGSISSAGMLLAGVAMSFFFSSLLLFSQYLSNFTQSFQIVRWLMGGLEISDFASLTSLIPFVAIGLLLPIYHSADLDAIISGDELAYSRGVDVRKTRNILFFTTSVMIGAVVSLTGPIGFIGIMVPHFCRLWIGASHRILLPCTIVTSGSFLVVCDSVSRIIVAPSDLPVGIITSLLGGPFFVWILLKRKEHLFWS